MGSPYWTTALIGRLATLDDGRASYAPRSVQSPRTPDNAVGGSDPERAAPDLVVASFNIHSGVDGWGRRFDLVRACAELDADLIVLQEAWTPDSGKGTAQRALGKARLRSSRDGDRHGKAQCASPSPGAQVEASIGTVRWSESRPARPDEGGSKGSHGLDRHHQPHLAVGSSLATRLRIGEWNVERRRALEATSCGHFAG